jgi:putative ABC transport system substrate-binding protein
VRRREFITLLGGAAAAWPLAARAQALVKRPQIGFLAVITRTASERNRSGFLQGLRESGYVEGRDIDLVERYADGFLERLPALIEELVHLKADAILAQSTSAALAVKQFTTTIPILVATMADPVRLGLIASEARPGGNVTGILVNLDGLPGKQFQLAAELVPGATKIGFLVNLRNPGFAFQRPEIEAVASTLRVELVIAGVHSPDDLDAAFQSLAIERVGSVMVGQDAMFNGERHRIAALAAAARLPWVSGARENAEAGAVISYGVNLRENYRRAATYIDKILKGTKPGELPVELPTKVEMVINLKSAKALGLTIPPALLGHANEVIE